MSTLEQCCWSIVSGGGRPRGKSDCGIPITQRKELGSDSLGSARGTEECYLKGEWCGQVSNLGKAVRRLPAGNETRQGGGIQLRSNKCVHTCSPWLV